MGGPGEDTTTTTQNSTQNDSPWAQQIPYLLEMFKRGQGSLDQAPAGNGMNMAAMSQLGKTLNGDYLFGNPESTKAIDAITTASTNRVMPAIDSKFADGGRYGGGLHKAALGQQIADTSSAAMANNYAAERSNMMNAASMTPNLADSADWKQKKLRDFAAMISGNYGGTRTSSSTGTQTTPLYDNPFAAVLGGAMSGFQMSGSPWGAAAGAGLGLLGGRGGKR